MTFGRPPIHPFGKLAVGEWFDVPVPTANDVKCMARNASQHGDRHGKRFTCKTDRKTRIMRITRTYLKPRVTYIVPDDLKDEYKHLTRIKRIPIDEVAKLLKLKKHMPKNATE